MRHQREQNTLFAELRYNNDDVFADIQGLPILVKLRRCRVLPAVLASSKFSACFRLRDDLGQISDTCTFRVPTKEVVRL